MCRSVIFSQAEWIIWYSCVHNIEVGLLKWNHVTSLKFLHASEIDQGLLAHTTNRDEGPPKKFKGEHLKFGLKFSMFAPITLELVG